MERSGDKMQKKKKFNWAFWLFLLLPTMLLAYFIGGVFLFKDLSFNNFDAKLLHVITHPFSQLYWSDKSKYVFLLIFMIYLIALSYSLANLKNYMPGKEMGSAEWGDPKKFNKNLASKDGDNIVLSKHCRKDYDSKKTLVNNNMFIIGGSGAGKTAGFIAPNLLQFHGSNIVTDPKGDTVRDFAEVLIAAGKRVRVINLNEMEKSHKYNPFKYIRSADDITRLITNFIANTTPAGSSPSDPFWDKAESLFEQGLFGYVWLECNDVPYYRYAQIKARGQFAEEKAKMELGGCDPDTVEPVFDDIWRGRVWDKNTKEHLNLKPTFRSVIKLLSEASVSDDEDKKSPLDCRMEVLSRKLVMEGKDPNDHPAIDNYNKCMRGAGDTVRSIVISANARFAALANNSKLLDILDDDDIDLPSLGIGVNGDQKTETILFCALPDDDSTYNFIAGMLYTQMFQELYRVARQYGNSLPIDVGCWFDEFANIKMPNDFDKILATCRSRNIYIAMVFQNQAQIKDLYKDKWEGLVGNCDTIIYLGGSEQSSHKYISEMLGKWTIDKRSTGRTFGANGSSSQNFDILGRELMTPDEVKNMSKSKMILFVTGEHPICDDKCYWFKQKEYKKYSKYPKYSFKPVSKPSMEILNAVALEHLHNDPNIELREYGCSFAELALLDFEEVHEIDMDRVKEQISSIRKEIEEKQNVTKLSRDMDIQELVVKANLNSEQLNKLSAAALANISEKILKELIITNADPERIQYVIDRFGQMTI